MTAQMGERLILDGEETSMLSCPAIPENDPRIEYGPDPGVILITCNWRNYLGTWEIKDRRLYLVALTGRHRLRETGPILADWFSGTLRVPKGEVLQYVHSGFASTYETELFIEIERGTVRDTLTIDYRWPGYSQLMEFAGERPVSEVSDDDIAFDPSEYESIGFERGDIEFPE